jgi:hypothetical protein
VTAYTEISASAPARRKANAASAICINHLPENFLDATAKRRRGSRLSRSAALSERKTLYAQNQAARGSLRIALDLTSFRQGRLQATFS